MIKVGSVWLNPTTIVAIIPAVTVEAGANLPIISVEGTNWAEADACEVRFVGGGGAAVDAPPSEVADAINNWARREEAIEAASS